MLVLSTSELCMLVPVYVVATDLKLLQTLKYLSSYVCIRSYIRSYNLLVAKQLSIYVVNSDVATYVTSTSDIR